MEQHWNGALLNSVDAVIQYAASMAWKGDQPVVELVTTTYQTRVKLTKEAMDAVETLRSSIAPPRKVVRGHRLFLTSCPG